MNALYFKAAWNLKFDEIPEPRPFTLADGTKVQTKMMEGDSKSYAASIINIDQIGDITALSVPYKVWHNKIKISEFIFPHLFASGRKV